MKASIRILHLRVVKGLYDISGNEESSTSNSTNNNKPPTILQFLAWAFGPGGPPLFKAVGVIGPGSSVPHDDTFYCREEGSRRGWCLVVPRRIRGYNFLRIYEEALHACRRDN